MATHARHKLNDLRIKAAIERHRLGEPRRKNADGTWAEDGFELLSDGGGLYLRTAPSGTAKWTYRFKSPDGRDREMGLGSYPEVTLKKAREKAQKQRDSRNDGDDPIDRRAAERAAARSVRAIPTFGEFADEYIRDKIVPSSTNEKHIYQWGQTLGDAYCSLIRPKRVDQLRVDDVLGVLRQRITRKKGGQEVTGDLWTLMPETASRLLDRIKRVLDYAIVEGHRSGENPARWTGYLEHKLPRPRQTVQHQPAMPYREVPALVAQLRERDAVSARALEFLILTAGRSGEVRGATWEEMDVEGKVWTIPASRMKARLEHRVPLSARALEILRTMAPKPEKASGLVFPSSRAGVPLSDMVFKALFDRMGLQGITAHGFRSSFRDWAGDEAGAPAEVAEAALAHVVGSKVERAYRRSDAFQRRKDLMDRWADYCDGSSRLDRAPDNG